MTVAEKMIWSRVRKLDLNIRRQSPIGPYTADFVQPSAKLVIEIDGYFHGLPQNQARDAERDAWLRSQGYEILRLPDAEVHRDPGAVTDRIGAAVRARLTAAARPTPPSPTLPPSRGKGDVPPSSTGEAGETAADPLASWRAP